VEAEGIGGAVVAALFGGEGCLIAGRFGGLTDRSVVVAVGVGDDVDCVGDVLAQFRQGADQLDLALALSQPAEPPVVASVGADRDSGFRQLLDLLPAGHRLAVDPVGTAAVTATYTDALGISADDLRRLRLLTWITRSRSDSATSSSSRGADSPRGAESLRLPRSREGGRWALA